MPVANRDYWEPKLRRTAARDGRNDAALISAGWTVIRVWEHEPSELAADRVVTVLRSLGIAGNLGVNVEQGG